MYCMYSTTQSYRPIVVPEHPQELQPEDPADHLSETPHRTEQVRVTCTINGQSHATETRGSSRASARDPSPHRTNRTGKDALQRARTANNWHAAARGSFARSNSRGVTRASSSGSNRSSPFRHTPEGDDSRRRLAPVDPGFG